MATVCVLCICQAFMPGLASGAASNEKAEKPASKPAATTAATKPDSKPGAAVALQLAPAVTVVTNPSQRPGSVVIIPIHDEVESGLAAFVERSLSEHPDAALFLLDINTFGGRVDAAVRIRDALLDTKVPTIAFVHRRAISAGALIALACDDLYVSSGASIGAATPYSKGENGAVEVSEKMISYMRAEMRATALAKKRPGPIAEAMVDSDVALPGIIVKGKLLTLDTQTALKYGVAVGQAESLVGLLTKLDVADRAQKLMTENWAEEVARVVTGPTISGMLLSLGMLAMMATIYTGNVGLITFIGSILLGLFFGGHAVVSLAGWEELALFVVGAGLLAAEVFVIPGFGVAGVLGILALVASLTLSMFHMPLGVAFELGMVTEAISRVVMSLFGSMVAAMMLIKLLPHTPVGRALVLSQRQVASEGFVSAPQLRADMIGSKGKALTDLRPEGRVLLDDGQRVDGRSDQAFIEVGVRVEVIEVDGPRLIVARVDDEAFKDMDTTEESV